MAGLALACDKVQATANAGADATLGAEVEAEVAAEVRSAELTYIHDIQPIYRAWCGDCHSGTAPAGCAGNTCFVDFYEALHFAAKTCSGWNMAQCGLKRVKDTAAGLPNKLIGKDGQPVLVPDADIDRITRWIALGLPER